MGFTIVTKFSEKCNTVRKRREGIEEIQQKVTVDSHPFPSKTFLPVTKVYAIHDQKLPHTYDQSKCETAELKSSFSCKFSAVIYCQKHALADDGANSCNMA